MTPLYYAISAVLVAWHWILTNVLQMNPDGGATWVLSIIGLTVTVRAALIPLFVKQIKSSRNMQLIQPKVKELQKKYGHDRERLAQETMKLYKESGTNPFASCLPILIQMPIFLALFRLLDKHAARGDGKAFITKDLAESFQNAQQQKLLLYVLPVVFAVGGIAFPIAVLFYWTTSNLWTMGQQFYVIRNNPAPGTAAEKAKLERDKAKAARHGKTVEVEPEPVPEPERRPQ